ncbi:MAG TPA: TIGR04076 family protein [candidate division Zixibacteria bacterium]|nr:TIGR04076 family protein [candidate division Zixibacteria bacterium]
MVKIKVEVSEIKGECSNGMKVGNHFFVEDHTLSIPEGTKVCIWALNKMLIFFPLLMERKDFRDDHWIKDIKSMKCADGKVIFSVTEID